MKDFVYWLTCSLNDKNAHLDELNWTFFIKVHTKGARFKRGNTMKKTTLTLAVRYYQRLASETPFSGKSKGNSGSGRRRGFRNHLAEPAVSCVVL